MTPAGHNLLNSRLRMLRGDVVALLDGLKYIDEELKIYGGPRVPSHVELQNRALSQRDSIDELLAAGASNQKAWIAYNCIHDEVTQVNQEVLEIVAGLAIHEKNVDVKICWVVRRFLEEITNVSLGLTVFTARDMNFPTLARLTRVRFPVKSIWTLPLAAHQFSNLQIKDAPTLDGFAKEMANREIKATAPPAGGRPSELLLRKLERKAYSRWLQLMADSLAVFFTGPCYAASAILMWLSPLGMDVDDDSQAPDTDRAYVILEMLRRMDIAPPGDSPPYAEFIDWLDSRWKKMLEDAGSAGASPERTKQLDGFVSDLIDLAKKKVGYARYRLVPESALKSGSWSTAQIWAFGWLNNLNNKKFPLDTPVSISGTVCDAFNAGWLAYSKIAGRTENVDDIADAIDATTAADAIEDAVRRICEIIVAPYLIPSQNTKPTGPVGTRPTRPRIKFPRPEPGIR